MVRSAAMSDPNRLTPTDEEIREMMFVIAKSFGATTDTPGPQTILYSLKLARTAYARGLQRAAEIAREEGNCAENGVLVDCPYCCVAASIDREREGQSEENR